MCEHVTQIGLRVDAAHARRTDQRVNGSGTLPAAVGAKEQ
jgi:hypothetical protein